MTAETCLATLDDALRLLMKTGILYTQMEAAAQQALLRRQEQVLARVMLRPALARGRSDPVSPSDDPRCPGA